MGVKLAWNPLGSSSNIKRDFAYHWLTDPMNVNPIEMWGEVNYILKPILISFQ